MNWWKVLAGVLAMVGLLDVAQAGADPVAASTDLALRVTGGAYVLDSGKDFFTFVGPQIELQQNTGVVTPKVRPSTCTTCTAGDVLDFTFRHPPSDPNGFVLFVDLGEGRGSIGDQTYPFIAFSGSMKFFATPILFPDTDDASIGFETPFTFRGWMRAGFQPGPFTGGSEFRLRGVGLVNATFVRDGGVYRQSGNVTYTFQHVTPEPSSLLLLGTGLVALGRRGWRRIQA